MFYKKGAKPDGGLLLCDESDFERLKLPAGWHECESKLGGSGHPVFISCEKRPLPSEVVEGVCWWIPLRIPACFLCCSGGEHMLKMEENCKGVVRVTLESNVPKLMRSNFMLRKVCHERVM